MEVCGCGFDHLELKTWCCGEGAPRKNGGSGIGRHTLLPGRDQDALFAPTIVMNREGGVLQHRVPGSIPTSPDRRDYLYGQGSSCRTLSAETVEVRMVYPHIFNR